MVLNTKESTILTKEGYLIKCDKSSGSIYDEMLISIYYKKDGTFIGSHKFSTVPRLENRELCWKVYTVENDITLRYTPIYTRVKKNPHGSLFDPYIGQLDRIELIIEVNGPYSFDRSYRLTEELMYDIVKKYSNYVTQGKPIYELQGDKTEIQTILSMIKVTRELSPKVSFIGSLSGIEDMLEALLCAIPKQIRSIRNKKDEQIRRKRSSYIDEGCYVPDCSKNPSGYYYSVVDIADPYSPSYQKWERGELGIIHGIKL